MLKTILLLQNRLLLNLSRKNLNKIEKERFRSNFYAELMPKPQKA
ncbi:hypothetical protein LEP1GSC059_2530 [Leptospira noguchii serovar Panama str. CZ214]|uniref:Uncharacterized protein n=1 Tax=Leptospira noguchii serovar Panama str. CZ214 TaxID=1001595 RepID=T0FVL0_9LEPT|nr:hypothetical protein LEP1GSC059_2530 [Leptospira noguchii serovar Panama str. CZ214]